jgi:hypothetical protein
MNNLDISPRYKYELRVVEHTGRSVDVIVDQFSIGIGGRLQVVAVPTMGQEYIDLLLDALNAWDSEIRLQIERRTERLQ